MKTVMLICLILSFTNLVKCQQTKEKFVYEMNYLLYTPEEYKTDTTKKWPLMLFLHGAGERGTDLEKVKVHGPPMLIEKGHEFPFIVVSPQAQKGWNPHMLYTMLENIIEKERVDKDRVYLTGLSMGGFGTWALAMKHPEMFAAIVPICGGGDPTEIWKLRHMPVWCIHGAKDDIVPLGSSEKMVNALKEFNPDVKFSVYPEEGHDSWIKAYDDSQLYEWILQQKKFRFKESDINTSIYKDYEGEYLIDSEKFKATLKIRIEDEKLIGNINKNTYQLKPASETVFYIHESQLAEMHFKRNEKDIVDRVELLDEDRIVAKRIK